jgi:hypothetical protein
MKKTLGILVAILLVVLLCTGLAVGLFDAGYLVVKIALYGSWTAGSYHDPQTTAIELYGTVSCLLIAVLWGAAIASRKGRQANAGDIKLVAGLVIVAATFSASGVILQFIHIGEIDVTGDGFRQTHYSTTTANHLVLYDASPTPVTVCLGVNSDCQSEITGPAELHAPGLTLLAGQIVDLAFPEVGTYPITVVDLPAPSRRPPTDAVVDSEEPYCDNPDRVGCFDPGYQA